MKRYGKIAGVLLGVGIIAGGVGIYYMLHQAPPPAPVEIGLPGLPAAKDGPPLPGTEVSSERSSPFVVIPYLRESDEWFRRQMEGLSTYARLSEWFKFDNLVRRLTAAVDNIAEGKSPRAHLAFMAPPQPFTVKKEQETIYLNPQSYGRFNLVADAFASVNADRAVRTFREAKPIFQEAYRELGYPNRDFEKTLIRAIKELLAVPVVDGTIALEEEVVTYGMVDRDLESLSAAQKVLLRMGPQNVRKIQNKLRQMALALGVPENQLPGRG